MNINDRVCEHATYKEVIETALGRVIEEQVNFDGITCIQHEMYLAAAKVLVLLDMMSVMADSREPFPHHIVMNELVDAMNEMAPSGTVNVLVDAMNHAVGDDMNAETDIALEALLKRGRKL